VEDMVPAVVGAAGAEGAHELDGWLTTWDALGTMQHRYSTWLVGVDGSWGFVPVMYSINSAYIGSGYSAVKACRMTMLHVCVWTPNHLFCIKDDPVTSIVDRFKTRLHGVSDHTGSLTTRAAQIMVGGRQGGYRRILSRRIAHSGIDIIPQEKSRNSSRV
jgi:hypothetical protein